MPNCHRAVAILLQSLRMRRRAILPSWVKPIAICVALAHAGTAHADVLEISDGEAVWKAGGPQQAAQSHPVQSQYLYGQLSNGAVIPARYVQTVANLSAHYDLSPALIEALVWQESRWRENALSPKGARGLAQLMPGTARYLGVDPDNPVENLEGGARYLREQLDRFDGNLEWALAAYNAGPGRVERSQGIPRIRETQEYVAAIMARLGQPMNREIVDPGTLAVFDYEEIENYDVAYVAR